MRLSVRILAVALAVRSLVASRSMYRSMYGAKLRRIFTAQIY